MIDKIHVEKESSNDQTSYKMMKFCEDKMRLFSYVNAHSKKWLDKVV